ncbi:MAG: catalase family protein [Actinomycetota bacterium]
MKRRLNDFLVAIIHIERRLDPLFRSGFDRIFRTPISSMVQALINLRRTDEHLGVAEEKLLPHENEITAQIIEHMATFLGRQYPPGQAQRAGNTKTYGIVRGTFDVLDDIPEEMRVGVFSRPRSYKTWVRFAGPGPLAPPDIEDNGILSIGVKLMGVAGEKLIDDEKWTQDFTGISAPTFTTPDIVENLKLQKHILEGTPILYFLSPFDSHLLDGIMQGLHARTHSSPLETPYYSCVAYLLGEGRAMHYSIRPCSAERSRIPRDFPDDYLREAMARALGEKEVVFDFMIQLQTDPHRMPIENASVEWPERLSPFVTVAKLRMPVQSFDSPEQLAFADNLSFNTWHCIAEHRPLGNQNRTRKSLYLELSKLRQSMNDTQRLEPTGDETFPGHFAPANNEGPDRTAAPWNRKGDGVSDRRSQWHGDKALVLAGVAFALFMLLHPYDELAGTRGPHSSAWVPAHTFHFLGALLALYGLLEVRDRWLARTSLSGKLAFGAAFIGTAMFVGTGMITAFLWPAVAEHAPSFVASDGPMFTDVLASGSITVTYIFLVVGYVSLAVVLRRSRFISTADTALLIAGVLLFSAPVEPLGPAPWILRLAGGIVFGAGLARLGLVLRSHGRSVDPELRPAALGRTP